VTLIYVNANGGEGGRLGDSCRAGSCFRLSNGSLTPALLKFFVDSKVVSPLAAFFGQQVQFLVQ